MKRTSKWYSELIGQEIQFVRWGHVGKPVLLFPTAGGDAEEVERFLVIRALAPLMEAGKINAHGVYTRVMHGPDGWEDATGWYTMEDLGGIDAVWAAGKAENASQTEEQKAEWMADMKKSFQMPGEGNHTDRILVVLHYGAAEPPTE